MDELKSDARMLSIVIPTRNRVECARACIEAARRAAPQAQIVIADSSDCDELQAHVRGLGESPERLSYLRTPAAANVVENFEAALSNCQGRYVIYCGDDDVIGPDIEAVAAWAQASGIDAVVPYGKRFGIAYYWPGVGSKYFGSSYSGRVFVWSKSGRFREVNAAVQVRRAQREVGRNLALLPRIYHGMVSRKLLVEAQSRFGGLFGGVSPDIYSALLIAKLAKRVVHLDYPFFIPGASPRSEAGSGAARTDRVAFDDSPYLKRFRDLRWNPLIPRFFAPYTVWGFSLVEGLKIGGWGESLLTYCRIYVRCYLYCAAYRAEVTTAVRLACERFGRARIFAALLGALIEEAGLSAVRLLPRLLFPRAGGWAQRYAEVLDSVAALELVGKLAGRFQPDTPQR
jgi:glycosyltransferase involved in cell wall biosynthesis